MNYNPNDTIQPQEPLFGHCPRCGAYLVYNHINQVIECPARFCGYCREYTEEDRKKIKALEAQLFSNFQKWDEIYEEQNSANDKLKYKNIFRP